MVDVHLFGSLCLSICYIVGKTTEIASRLRCVRSCSMVDVHSFGTLSRYVMEQVRLARLRVEAIRELGTLSRYVIYLVRLARLLRGQP